MGRRVICTLSYAQRLWPTAPVDDLQALSQWLPLRSGVLDISVGVHPQFEAFATALLLEHILAAVRIRDEHLSVLCDLIDPQNGCH